MSYFDVTDFASILSHLFCHVSLLYLRNFFFSEEIQEGNGTSGEGRCEEILRSRLSKNYNQELLDEKINYFL